MRDLLNQIGWVVGLFRSGNAQVKSMASGACLACRIDPSYAAEVFPFSLHL
jgi:hypothetical protein